MAVKECDISLGHSRPAWGENILLENLITEKVIKLKSTFMPIQSCLNRAQLCKCGESQNKIKTFGTKKNWQTFSFHFAKIPNKIDSIMLSRNCFMSLCWVLCGCLFSLVSFVSLGPHSYGSLMNTLRDCVALDTWSLSSVRAKKRGLWLILC